MEDIVRWLLMCYLPILAPIVFLTLFTWPWRLIGHSIRGIIMAVRSTWRSYSRSSRSHRRQPFSFWRNVFMGSWQQLARQRQARLDDSSAASMAVELVASSSGLPRAYHDTLLDAANETRSRLHLELRTCLTQHAIWAGFLFIVLVRPSHVPPTASAPVSSAGTGGTAVDLAGLFSGLAFILALAAAGVCAQLASLLNMAATPHQLYWFIVTWERALGGGQLASGAIFTLTLAAGLTAAYQLYAPYVFITLLFTAATAFYAFTYFWADSMWCPYNGAVVQYSQAFHREVAGVDALAARPSFCAFWELEPVLDVDVPGSLYARMHAHLWHEQQMAYYVSSSGGGAAVVELGGAAAAAPGSIPVVAKAPARYQQRNSSTSDGSHLTEVTAGEPSMDNNASWPFMRHSYSANGGAAAAASGAGTGGLGTGGLGVDVSGGGGGGAAAAAAAAAGRQPLQGRLKKTASGLTASGL